MVEGVTEGRLAKGKAKKQEFSLRFRSRTEHSLDAKGRLNIPSRFREVLREVYSETVAVTSWDKCLKVYPAQEWEAIEEKLLNEGKKQPGLGDFLRLIVSGVAICPLDKQGRILVPPTLRGEMGIDREVVLNGMLDHFEIWDKSAWQLETKRTRERFADFGPGLSSLGIL